MDQPGDATVSTILKQPLLLALLLSAFAHPALADGAPVADNAMAEATSTAPAQAPVQLGWDRVGDRERSWA
jgi:hypothetical protein